ncbi:hypothetical protein Golomagni_07665 [Golovinomyces magnicellulatus]|nr:hypothetical protein Golomagni_07665 [Golovinomyces magnicellulatus]
MSTPAIGSQASRLAKDFTLKGVQATRMPKFCYGTAWKKDKSADLVYRALKAGFRGIDTAAQPKHYNEQGVASGFRKAVSEGIVTRQDVFVQTKFTPVSGQSHSVPYDVNAPLDQQVHQSVQSSLQNFTIDGQDPYLDSIVLHSPLETIQDTFTVWKAFESYYPHTIRNLGISNAPIEYIEAIHQEMAVKPAVAQNRFFHREGFAAPIRSFCRDNDIIFQSFWTSTGNPRLVQSQPVVDVAEKAGVELAAAYYCLVLGLGNVTILNGTTSDEHMQQDLQGLETVGAWSEAEGAADWKVALETFKQLIREP